MPKQRPDYCHDDHADIPSSVFDDIKKSQRQSLNIRTDSEMAREAGVGKRRRTNRIDRRMPCAV